MPMSTSQVPVSSLSAASTSLKNLRGIHTRSPLIVARPHLRPLTGPMRVSRGSLAMIPFGGEPGVSGCCRSAARPDLLLDPERGEPERTQTLLPSTRASKQVENLSRLFAGTTTVAGDFCLP